MEDSAVARRFGSDVHAARRDAGRAVFGFAAIVFGLVKAVWALAAHGHSAGTPIPVPLRDTVICISAVGLVAGGIAVQRKDALRFGNALLLAGYALYCLLFLPAVAAAPLVFSPWGNLFEPLTMVAAAAILLARTLPPDRKRAILQAARFLFALCVASFALYQAFYPAYTATLVPAWIPPGQMFWTVATTVAFALAAAAVFVRRLDLPAVRLLTLMVLLFQVLIWIPAVIAHPAAPGMWAENVLNFAIAASCWVFADFLESSPS